MCNIIKVHSSYRDGELLSSASRSVLINVVSLESMKALEGPNLVLMFVLTVVFPVILVLLVGKGIPNNFIFLNLILVIPIFQFCSYVCPSPSPLRRHQA